MQQLSLTTLQLAKAFHNEMNCGVLQSCCQQLKRSQIQVNLEKVEALLTIYQRFNSNKLANKKQQKTKPGEFKK
jgi:hypothetical protein